MGIWKFHERVGNKDLLEVADEWAKDEKYLQIYVRRVSKDQYGIGFVYDSDGSKEAQDVYFDQASDWLKRKFGNDLVGWDLSSGDGVMLVKGF